MQRNPRPRRELSGFQVVRADPVPARPGLRLRPPADHGGHGIGRSMHEPPFVPNLAATG